jgi:hypothetical protein
MMTMPTAWSAAVAGPDKQQPVFMKSIPILGLGHGIHQKMNNMWVSA